MTAEDRTLPYDHLRCRAQVATCGSNDIARERCCDPDWDRILVAVHEWETPELSGIEYAGLSAVAGLDYGWHRRHDAAA